MSQCLALSARGVRVIAVDAPAYWSVEEWCRGFKQLLTQLSLEKILTNHHHMISKKYLNMITYSPNRCVISAICYILVIVGIQINNRLDSKERHESCQFAFERQSEGIDLNPRVMT